MENSITSHISKNSLESWGGMGYGSNEDHGISCILIISFIQYIYSY